MIEEKLDRMIELLEMILGKICYPSLPFPTCPCYQPYQPWYREPWYVETSCTTTNTVPECTAR